MKPINGLFQAATLPYAKNALAPVISENTLDFHYGKHLQAYLDNLNAALPGSGMEGLTLQEIVRKAEGGLFNNAGQVLNHNLYFTQFRAYPSGPHSEQFLTDNRPYGVLGDAIYRDFGSFEAFKETFQQKGVTLFGSGWVWLSTDAQGYLTISQEPNAGNPVRSGRTPLLTFDVWEHAYYLDYQNRRAAHLSALWSIIDWKVIEDRYEAR